MRYVPVCLCAYVSLFVPETGVKVAVIIIFLNLLEMYDKGKLSNK
jgi:hypothetical protein